MKVMERDIDWFHQSIYMNTVYVNNFCPKELRYYFGTVRNKDIF